MIKLPAVVGDDDETFGGSIFTNPGGPGGSGVEQVLGGGEWFQKLTALEGKRNYEIVSFDPRGVGLTQPTSDCFHTDRVGRDAFVFEARGVGRLDGGGHAVPYRLAMVDGFGNRCLEAEEAYGDGMAFVNTPSVARDMVAMIDKIDELRKGSRADRDDDRLELRKRSISSENNESRDLPRLQYMGFSYGTVLGNYFATLFPGRVGRLLLDGVDNADDYAQGPGWLTNLEDTDEIFDTFFEGCFKAGPSVCPLLREEDMSAEDTKTRVWSWINHLGESPQSALDASGLPLVISAIDVLSMVGESLYNPTPSFRQMARIINDSMRGNYTELISQLKNSGLPAIEDACALRPGNSIGRPEAQSAILCGDGDDISDKDVPWWEDYITQQANASQPKLVFQGSLLNSKTGDNSKAATKSAGSSYTVLHQ
ncbi:hypothetical protein K4F52_001265 [Lecanicillium sp. MT-2017a]|nr:hypothetical protein K4F52_001265 [Lecanicillium sp. MT-2017a]